MVIDDNAQSLLARGRHPETKKQTKQKQQTMGTPLRFDMILPNGQPLRYGMAGARWNGTVEEVLPNSLFRVRLTANEEGVEGELVLAYLAGKMRLNRIRVLVGDSVEMVTDPYGGKARIVRRLS